MNCPHCNNNNISAYGYRQTVAEKQRIFKCNNCEKRFTNKYIKNTKYKPYIIAKAISLYNLGYTLTQTQSLLSKHHKTKPPISTIHDWLNRYKDTFTFTNTRRKRNLNPKTIIKSRTFFHEQPFKYQFHTFKSSFIPKNVRFFLNNLLRQNINIQNLNRCSVVCKNIKNNIQTKEKDNITKKLTRFALESITTNKDRHKIVQELMLINDSATIATEVPIHNKQLLGHIDILQYRFNKVYILDYKPLINKDSMNQVILYKQLFSENTNTSLDNIKVACFNENQYVEIE